MNTKNFVYHYCNDNFYFCNSEKKSDKRNGMGIYVYKNGSGAVGSWKDNKMDGKGIFVDKDNNIFIGDWENDKETKGMLVYENGNIYVGEVNNHKKCGKGTIYLANGNSCEGSFSKNKINGKGKYIAIDNDDNEYCIVANFENNLINLDKEIKLSYKNKEYKLTANNINIIKNNCSRNIKGNTFDILSCNNKTLTECCLNKIIKNKIDENIDNSYEIFRNDKYKATIINEEKERKGVFVWSDGTKYVGNWKYGEINGIGQLFYKNGNKYIGNFTKSYLNGDGVLIQNNGKEKYVGNFKDDKIDGIGIKIYSNGDKYIGNWENNKINGKGAVIFQDGNRYFGNFKNGNINGLGTYVININEEIILLDGEFIGESINLDKKIRMSYKNCGELSSYELTYNELKYVKTHFKNKQNESIDSNNDKLFIFKLNNEELKECFLSIINSRHKKNSYETNIDNKYKENTNTSENTTIDNNYVGTFLSKNNKSNIAIENFNSIKNSSNSNIKNNNISEEIEEIISNSDKKNDILENTFYDYNDNNKKNNKNNNIESNISKKIEDKSSLKKKENILENTLNNHYNSNKIDNKLNHKKNSSSKKIEENISEEISEKIEIEENEEKKSETLQINKILRSDKEDYNNENEPIKYNDKSKVKQDSSNNIIVDYIKDESSSFLHSKPNLSNNSNSIKEDDNNNMSKNIDNIKIIADNNNNIKKTDNDIKNNFLTEKIKLNKNIETNAKYNNYNNKTNNNNIGYRYGINNNNILVNSNKKTVEKKNTISSDKTNEDLQNYNNLLLNLEEDTFLSINNKLFINKKDDKTYIQDMNNNYTYKSNEIKFVYNSTFGECCIKYKQGDKEKECFINNKNNVKIISKNEKNKIELDYKNNKNNLEKLNTQNNFKREDNNEKILNNKKNIVEKPLRLMTNNNEQTNMKRKQQINYNNSNVDEQEQNIIKRYENNKNINVNDILKYNNNDINNNIVNAMKSTNDTILPLNRNQHYNTSLTIGQRRKTSSFDKDKKNKQLQDTKDKLNKLNKFDRDRKLRAMKDKLNRRKKINNINDNFINNNFIIKGGLQNEEKNNNLIKNIDEKQTIKMNNFMNNTIKIDTNNNKLNNSIIRKSNLIKIQNDVNGLINKCNKISPTDNLDNNKSNTTKEHKFAIMGGKINGISMANRTKIMQHYNMSNIFNNNDINNNQINMLISNIQNPTGNLNNFNRFNKTKTSSENLPHSENRRDINTNVYDKMNKVNNLFNEFNKYKKNNLDII